MEQGNATTFTETQWEWLVTLNGKPVGSDDIFRSSAELMAAGGLVHELRHGRLRSG